MRADYAAEISAGNVYIAQDQGMILFYPRGDAMFLETVAVHPEHQGKGIGGALIRFCEDNARANNYGRVQLYTNFKMTGNLTLYPKLGYVETARKTEDGFDRVYFEKSL